MSFTTLYAELVVVGTGALIFILLFFYSFFGDVSWFSKFGAKDSFLGNAVILIPALSVIYLLGIVIANVSHLLFQPFESCLRIKRLEKCGKGYQTIVGALYLDPKAKDLIADFEFRRSKVRICRGWFVNCVFIIIACAVCAFEQPDLGAVALFWIVSSGLLMVGTAISWWTATTTELMWLREYALKLPQTPRATARKHRCIDLLLKKMKRSAFGRSRPHGRGSL